MRNWLIRLLGGVTRVEHDVAVQTEAALHSYQKDAIQDLRRRLDREREEVKVLSNGIGQPVVAPPVQEPIALRGMSWMQRKSALEKKERARRESRAAHVRELENQWAERDTLEPTGPIERENTH